MNRALSRLVLAASALMAPGSGATAQTPGAPPDVLVSIRPLHSIVSAVMAGAGDPDLLIEGGASPHSYALTPSNARKLAGAEIVFWAGPELEIFLEGPLRTLSTQAEIHAFSQSPELVTLAVREGGLWDEHEHGDEGGHDEAAIDAHFWLDPRNGTVIAREAARILGESDPERAALYAQNAERLAGRLTALDAQLEANLGAASGIPYVVFHDAYQYFEARYRLSPAGSVSVAADRPAGTRRIVEIRARIAEADVKCVFAPPQFPPRLIVTLIENAAARSAVLDEFGTAIDAGPELYETLLTQLADDFLSCLAP